MCHFLACKPITITINIYLPHSNIKIGLRGRVSDKVCVLEGLGPLTAPHALVLCECVCQQLGKHRKTITAVLRDARSSGSRAKYPFRVQMTERERGSLCVPVKRPQVSSFGHVRSACAHRSTFHSLSPSDINNFEGQRYYICCKVC